MWKQLCNYGFAPANSDKPKSIFNIVALEALDIYGHG